MERTVVNPWQWSVSMGFNQGEVVSGHSRTLFCAGQASVDANGAPQHPGDVAAQVGLAGTLLGVSRLAFPELLVELEATAVD